ncbi:MAG: TonB-dependent receptor, partial [Pseudomonadota bacterium]
AIRMEPADKWVVRSSLGAGLKMPKLGEISNAATLSVGTNTPVEADVRGNPNLLPERSINFEAVMERYLDAEAGVLGANLYVRSTQDFTERRVQFEGTRWVDRPQNEGRAMHWGFELDGKIRTDSFGWKGATLKSHLTLPHAQVKDERLGITRMAQDTPKYVFSAGLDETLPSLQSSYGITLQLSGRSVTDIPGEKYGYTKARTTVDAFWLYRFNPKFKLRVSGQNLLATDTERSTRYMSGGDTWQLNAVEHGYRSLVATLEGRW